MQKLFFAMVLFLTVQACGRADESVSSPTNLLVGSGWMIEQSPYMLPPGSTIGVCDPENTGVSHFIIDATRMWLDVGGRDERIFVRESCTGTRVIRLHKVHEKVDYYGQAHPLQGNVHKIDVASQWAGHWTANHEMGHVFGFAHIFEKVVSIMNSDQNGLFMNGGNLSSYDRMEIDRMLSLSPFKKVNALWAQRAQTLRKPLQPTPKPSTPKDFRSCLGVDGKTFFAHKVVTTYLEETFTCKDGSWIRG